VIIDFELHGFDELVEGKLDIGDHPVPQIGWVLEFDAVGQVRVSGVDAYYVVVGCHKVTLQLAWEMNPSVVRTAADVVEFFKINSDLTAFSGVRLGEGRCTCLACR
jgi:hypothetical protein